MDQLASFADLRGGTMHQKIQRVLHSASQVSPSQNN
jgi:hypothetical protein